MTTINDLTQQRAKLAAAADCISASIRDIERFGKEGAEYPGYAVCWAAGMLATGIIKTGLSAVDKRASEGFGLIDNATTQANRWLAAAKMPTIATKSDVRGARNDQQKAGAKPPVHLALVLDLATQMSEDMTLMLEAGQLQGRVVKNTGSNVAQVGARLHAIRIKSSRLDSQVQMLIAKRDLMERTA